MPNEDFHGRLRLDGERPPGTSRTTRQPASRPRRRSHLPRETSRRSGWPHADRAQRTDLPAPPGRPNGDRVVHEVRRNQQRHDERAPRLKRKLRKQPLDLPVANARFDDARAVREQRGDLCAARLAASRDRRRSRCGRARRPFRTVPGPSRRRRTRRTSHAGGGSGKHGTDAQADLATAPEGVERTALPQAVAAGDALGHHGGAARDEGVRVCTSWRVARAAVRSSRRLAARPRPARAALRPKRVAGLGSRRRSRPRSPARHPRPPARGARAAASVRSNGLPSPNTCRFTRLETTLTLRENDATAVAFARSIASAIATPSATAMTVMQARNPFCRT